MLNFKTTSSNGAQNVTASIAMSAILWTSGAGASLNDESSYTEHTHRDLLYRFSEGRSGDPQWGIFESEKYSFSQEKSSDEVIDPELMVNTILGSLGLGMTDLEKVLGVKRATIYNWRNGGEVRADDSINRLRDIYEVAQQVAIFNTKPFGKRAKSHTINGKSYLDLLSANSLDQNAIVTHAKVLSSQENARIKASQKSTANDIDNILGGWHQV